MASSMLSALAVAAATDSISATKAESVANGIACCGAGLRLATWATVAAVAPAPTNAAIWARRFGLFEDPDICSRHRSLCGSL